MKVRVHTRELSNRYLEFLFRMIIQDEDVEFEFSGKRYARSVTIMTHDTVSYVELQKINGLHGVEICTVGPLCEGLFIICRIKNEESV